MNELELILRNTSGIDYDTAIKRMSDNSALYAELLRLFFSDEPQRKLMSAFVNGDYVSAANEAHSMKGTAANLGLTEISRLASAVNQCLKENNELQANIYLIELNKVCNDVKGVVNQVCGGSADEKK